jgi:hypothetical protein
MAKGTITVQGKQYPCYLTNGAMLRYKRHTGEDVSKMSTSDTANMIEFMYHCTASACRAENVDFDMDLDTFADYTTPADLQAFAESLQNDSKKK